MKTRSLLLVLLLTFTGFVFSQNKEDVSKITKNYNLDLLKELQVYYKNKEAAEKKAAYEAAQRNGWPIIIEKDGVYQELMKLTPDGYPVYFSTESNVIAARSTRANFLNEGGGLGLNLDGQGMIARVWDGGPVRGTHNAFYTSSTNFTSRITNVDVAFVSASTNSSHGTHVAGTILSLPWSTTTTVLSTKGMATKATGRTFDWTDDESEAISEAAIGMLLSNHSYGVPLTGGSGPLPAWYIGSYVEDSRVWDEITYNAPYYLPVISAGNDGNNNDNSDPISSGYDKLIGNKVAKNVLTIANAQDANIAADGSLTGVLINSSSSQGPSDDRRIKPDIAGNGTGLVSPISTSNTNVGDYTGTSMAAPNVTGTLLLLQQYHNQLHNYFMKAATLKGLACHTADDAGDAGPDAKFGWGLLNAKKAAETLRDNGLNSWISENTLNQGGTYTMTVRSNGGTNNPLIASITWTDLPGEANNGQRLEPNDTFRSLINDLDIRITKDGTTYFPWKLQLDPTMLAVRNGDNNVDNIEVIRIDNPTAGDYVITITHKGTLVTGKQDYSLIITGIASSFALTSTSDDLIKCDNETATYTFNHRQTGVGTTNFSAEGIPAGANASISPSSLSANGLVTLTLSNLNGVIPGDYNVGIIGNNGTETESRTKKLKIYSSTFQPTVLTTPTNGFNGASTIVNLDWADDANAESYTVQLSLSPTFSPLITQQTTSDTNLMVYGLQQETTYYWRVNPSNRCGIGNFSNATINSFTTGVISCGNIFEATDFSNATVATTANSSASVPVQVTGGLTIGELRVTLEMTHTWVQDMTITLRGPAEIGSPTVTLLREACTSQDNINCVFVDTGGEPQCSATPPAIFDLIAPFESLSNLNGLSADGTWTLLISDPYNGDGGTVSRFRIEVCNITLNTPTNALNSLKVFPNPSKGIININLGENLTGETTYVLYDVQGRIVMNKKSNTSMETLNVENVSNGVYLLSIENGAAKTTQKIIINK
jgi:subtilisin-like proprotein convertase family protein